MMLLYQISVTPTKFLCRQGGVANGVIGPHTLKFEQESAFQRKKEHA